MGNRQIVWRIVSAVSMNPAISTYLLQRNYTFYAPLNFGYNSLSPSYPKNFALEVVLHMVSKVSVHGQGAVHGQGVHRGRGVHRP